MRRWARGDLVEAGRVGDGRAIVFALKAAAAVGIPLLLYRLTGNFRGTMYYCGHIFLAGGKRVGREHTVTVRYVDPPPRMG